MIKSEEILKRFNSKEIIKEQRKEFGEVQIGTIFVDAYYEEDGSWEDVYSSLVLVEDRLFLIECDENGELQEDMENFDIDYEVSLNEMSLYRFNREVDDLVIYKNILQDHKI